MNYLEGAQPYLSMINGVEDKYGLPRNLLVRVAFQECSWRSDVINGEIRSSAGAIGMFQLMPEYFPNAGRSISGDAASAANLLHQCYDRFRDWQLAIAAYNWGQGNLHACIVEHAPITLLSLPTQTANYVRQVFADVPISGCLV